MCMHNLDGQGAVRGTNRRGEEYALYFSGESRPDLKRDYSREEEEKIADPDVLDAVYNRLLATLTLSLEHRENLISRGLTEAWIDKANYKTAPKEVIPQTIANLRKEFGVSTLKIVPGFVETTSGIIFNGRSGILIPTRDTRRRIVALKLRRDGVSKGSDRYRWITSRTEDYQGPSPGSPAHVPLWSGGKVKEVRITEGELKADVATELSGILTLSIPGATSVRSCIRALEDLGPKTVRLAWDADKAKVPEPVEEGKPKKRNFVAIGLQNAALLLHSKGYKVVVEHWPIAQGKGIDDMLSQRREGSVLVYEGERAWRVIEQTLIRVGENPLPEVKQLAHPRAAEELTDDHGDRADEVFPELPPDSNWLEELPRRENGTIICRLSSLATILRNDPQWAGRLAFDEMSRTPLLDGKPIEEPLGMLPIQEKLEKHWDFTIDSGKLTGSVLLAASENSFHPVRRYLSGLRWDGERRIERIVSEVLRIENPQEIDSTYVRMMLLSAVRRITSPGTKVDTTFVLQGPQGAKKSTFFRVLGSPWFSDTHMNIDDRDGKMQLAASWIYEWGEIEKITTLKHGALVKSFLSSSEDTVRLPYAKSVTRIPRHSIIVGTTNEEHFLTDATGDRRYWVVKVSQPVNEELLLQWRDQLWAEAVHIASAGEKHEPHYLNAEQEKTRADRNEQFRGSEMWEDIVVRWMSIQEEILGCYTLDEVFRLALGVEPRDVTKGDERRMAQILRSLGFANTPDKVTFYRAGKKLWMRGWLTPKAGPWLNASDAKKPMKVDDPHSPSPKALILNSSNQRW